jgi:surface antigen
MKIPFIIAAIVAANLLIAGPNVAATDAQPAEQNKKEEAKEVIVTVKTGDTLTSIAEANKTTYVRLYNANKDLVDPNVINEGDKVRVPKDDETLTDRYSEYEASVAAYAAQVAASQPVYYAQPTSYYSYTPTASSAYRGSTAGNTYYQGYCTWYAKNRRPDLPNMLGNGGEWVNNAAAQGYATGSTPKAGAIAETAGHVTYVESVNNNGTITISEMNGTAGFGNVGTRTVPASDYRYIY